MCVMLNTADSPAAPGHHDEVRVTAIALEVGRVLHFR